MLRRHPTRLLRLPRVLPVLARFLAGRANRGELKAAFISASLGGLSRRELEDWTARFVPRLLATGAWHDALAAVAEHRASGDTLILMSASPDLYVPTIARALGFDAAVCTQLRWDGERLGGELVGANVRGTEKARRLEALRARYPGLPVVAYGNAASDLTHLTLAERGVLVNGSRQAREEAAKMNIERAEWR
jgi:phosphatidylglycerophosphatase C